MTTKRVRHFRTEAKNEDGMWLYSGLCTPNRFVEPDYSVVMVGSVTCKTCRNMLLGKRKGLPVRPVGGGRVFEYEPREP